MKKLRYGILSTASIVPRFLAALRESGTGEAIAVASRDADRAAEKARDWHIPQSYGSYEAMLAEGGFDVVYVASINSEHYACAKMALEHGYHVICEKPFTLRSDQARELFALAAKQECFIAEAQKAVFLPVMEEIRKILASGTLGKVQFLDFTSSCDPVYNAWLHSLAAGGGALYGSEGYSLHLAKYILGLDITQYSGLCTFGQSEVDEQCVVNLRLGDDVMAVSKISTNVLALNRAYIFCDKGFIEIPDFWKARSASIHFRTGETQLLSYPCDHELIYEIEHFDHCIRNGLLQSPIMDEDLTISVIAIMEDLQRQWLR